MLICLLKDFEFNVSEDKHRFGEHTHVYVYGCNFSKYMIENMKKTNDNHISEFLSDIYMMEYLNVLIKS